LGAYCPQDQEYVDIRQAEGTISAPHVIQLLEKIQKKHPTITVFVIHLDNARYQHARMLKEWIQMKQETEGVTFETRPRLLAQPEPDRTHVEISPQARLSHLAQDL
jgi:hypothetical protein